MLLGVSIFRSHAAYPTSNTKTAVRDCLSILPNYPSPPTPETHQADGAGMSDINTPEARGWLISVLVISSLDIQLQGKGLEKAGCSLKEIIIETGVLDSCSNAVQYPR